MKPSNNWEESLERAAERLTKPNWRNTYYCWLNNWFGWLPIQIPIAYCQIDLDAMRDAVISYRVDWYTYASGGSEAIQRGVHLAAEKTIAKNLGLVDLSQLKYAMEEKGELNNWEAIQEDIKAFSVASSAAVFRRCFAQGRGERV